MRTALTALGVVALLVGLQAAFGGALLVLAKACRAVIAECTEVPFVGIVIGLAALAMTLWLARKAVTLAGSGRRR